MLVKDRVEGVSDLRNALPDLLTPNLESRVQHDRCPAMTVRYQDGLAIDVLVSPQTITMGAMPL